MDMARYTRHGILFPYLQTEMSWKSLGEKLTVPDSGAAEREHGLFVFGKKKKGDDPKSWAFHGQNPKHFIMGSPGLL